MNILKLTTLFLVVKCIVTKPAYRAVVKPKGNDEYYSQEHVPFCRGKAVLNGEEIKGVIRFEQMEEDGKLRVYGEINSLQQGAHGFHVHEFGDLSNFCENAGKHFNPFLKTHGGPNMFNRHLGDLGNIVANSNGVAKFDFYDLFLRLNGPNGIIGRSIVIHKDADDLGMGDTPLSKTTGNSGARIACSIIDDDFYFDEEK